MKKPIKIPINNIIFRDVTCNAFQKGCIKNTVLIFSGINTKIGTDGSSPITPD